jgi:hypothetical protein
MSYIRSDFGNLFFDIPEPVRNRFGFGYLTLFLHYTIYDNLEKLWAGNVLILNGTAKAGQQSLYVSWTKTPVLRDRVYVI